MCPEGELASRRAGRALVRRRFVARTTADALGRDGSAPRSTQCTPANTAGIRRVPRRRERRRGARKPERREHRARPGGVHHHGDHAATGLALLHIEKHGSIDEAELTSLVGGPRGARVFARNLDTWRATLPFGVEVSTARGIKIYRRVTVG